MMASRMLTLKALHFWEDICNMSVLLLRSSELAEIITSLIALRIASLESGVGQLKLAHCHASGTFMSLT